MPSQVLSTYRLQMRGDSFTFADAEQQLDYLDALGVSHLYLSPILTAGEGSTHGYDVTDPTTVSAALGGPDGLARLSAAARARGMGLIVDIVPNHLGVDDPKQNPWWWDVLEHGRFVAVRVVFRHRLGPGSRWPNCVAGRSAPMTTTPPRTTPPTRRTTGRSAGATVSADTAGSSPSPRWPRSRQEDRAVFDATHVEVKRWFDEGLVDGVRIDHPDGLSDPAGYLAWLRELIGPTAWIVIEKILAVDEPLEPTLPVAGTTGYDALREIGGVFIDPAGAGPLTDLFSSAGTDYAEMPLLARDSRSTPSPTPWAASWPACTAPSPRPPAPTTRTCPTPWPR